MFIMSFKGAQIEWKNNKIIIDLPITSNINEVKLFYKLTDLYEIFV